jgi:hypothetical protein
MPAKANVKPWQLVFGCVLNTFLIGILPVAVYLFCETEVVFCIIVNNLVDASYTMWSIENSKLSNLQEVMYMYMCFGWF